MDISDAVLDLTIPPQPHLSRIVRDRVIAFAAAHGVDEDDLSNILTALGEAVANAIEHARADTPIRIECRISAERIQAVVADSGVGFPRDRATFTDLPEPTAERGRGLPLMRRCSDIFQVRSSPGRGTSVKVGRFLRRPPRNPHDRDGRMSA
jgi:anti-sigma regulatory factor (Ser/Thr protein kinase)